MDQKSPRESAYDKGIMNTGIKVMVKDNGYGYSYGVSVRVKARVRV